MDEICRSEELIKLLGCANEGYPENIIPYKWCFPYEYIPNAAAQAGRYINFEIGADIDPKNKVYKNLILYFYALCHENEISYEENGKTYLWYDKAAYELENIFCKNKILGIGDAAFKSNTPYSPGQNFKGRLLQFSIKDFNNGMKYGK